MAFSKNGIARTTSSQVGTPLFAVWIYNGNLASIDDDLATIKASAYFNDVAADLAIGDRFHLEGNDGSDLVKVTAVSPDVEVVSILATLPAGSVTLAELSPGITMSHIVKFAGERTTVGGAATEAFTVTGALVTDLAFVTLETEGGGAVQVHRASVTAPDTLTVTFSANPSTDHVIAFQILRAAA